MNIKPLAISIFALFSITACGNGDSDILGLENPETELPSDGTEMVTPPIGLIPDGTETVTPPIGLVPDGTETVTPPIGLIPDETETVTPPIGLTPETVTPPIGEIIDTLTPSIGIDSTTPIGEIPEPMLTEIFIETDELGDKDGDGDVDTIIGANTSGDSGTIRNLTIRWTRPTTDNSVTGIIYTLYQCEEGTTAYSDAACKEITEVVDQLNYTLESDSLIDVAKKPYIVVASKTAYGRNEVVESNAAIAPAAEINNMIGYFKQPSPKYSSGAEFGTSVEISGDGTTIVASQIGAYVTLAGLGSLVTGTVVVYKSEINSDGFNEWSSTKSLHATNPLPVDYGKFGADLSLNKAGDVLAISSPGANEQKGLVYIYKYDNSDWAQSGDALQGISTTGVFGEIIELSDDGNVLLAQDGSNVLLFNAPFSNNPTTLFDNSTGSNAIALSHDANYAAVASNTGLYIYNISSPTIPSLAATLTTSETFSFVSMNKDGSRIAAITNNNVIYIYDYDNGNWSENINISGFTFSGQSPTKLKLSENGELLAISSSQYPSSTEEGIVSPGAIDNSGVYLYELTSDTPTIPEVALHSPHPIITDNPQFGADFDFTYTDNVNYTGLKVVIGAPNEETNGGEIEINGAINGHENENTINTTKSGAIYIY